MPRVMEEVHRYDSDMSDRSDRSSEDLLREAKRSLESQPSAADEPPELDAIESTPPTADDPFEAAYPPPPVETEFEAPAAPSRPERTETDRPTPAPPERPRREARQDEPPRRTDRGDRLLASVPVHSVPNRAIAVIAPLLLGLGIAAFFALSAGGVSGAMIIGLFLLVSLFRLLRRLARNRGSSPSTEPVRIGVTTDRVVLTHTDSIGNAVETTIPLTALREWEVGRGRFPSIELEFDDGNEVAVFLTPDDAGVLEAALRTVAPDAED